MFYNILDSEGLKNWKIKWNTGGGLCVYNHNEIWMGKEQGRLSMALFLHEVAHALCPKDKCGICWTDDTGHNVIWGDCFTKLVKKYMF